MATAATFTGQKLEPYMYPCEARTMSVRFSASKTIAKGTILGRKTSGNTWEAYDDNASSGVEVAKAIAMYDIVTDSDGKIYFGAAAASELGEYSLTAPVYVAGTFHIGDLTGLDANGLADLNATLIQGDSVSDTTLGVIRIG